MQSQSFFISQMTIDRGPSLGEINGKVIFFKQLFENFTCCFAGATTACPTPPPSPDFNIGTQDAKVAEILQMRFQNAIPSQY